MMEVNSAGSNPIIQQQTLQTSRADSEPRQTPSNVQSQSTSVPRTLESSASIEPTQSSPSSSRVGSNIDTFA